MSFKDRESVALALRRFAADTAVFNPDKDEIDETDPTSWMVLIADRLRYRGEFLSENDLKRIDQASGNITMKPISGSVREWDRRLRRFIADRPLPADFKRTDAPLRWQVAVIAWSYHLDPQLAKGAQKNTVPAILAELSRPESRAGRFRILDTNHSAAAQSRAVFETTAASLISSQRAIGYNPTMKQHAIPRISTIARMTMLIVLATIVSGCGRGEPLGPRSLRKARETWLRSGIRSYDVEWTVSGPQTGGRVVHYRIAVRGGLAETVKVAHADGSWTEVNTHKPEYFTIDGLFRTLEEEMDQLDGPTPFGKPKGTSVLLEFTPDDTLGYPRRYRRDVVGVKPGLAIDVIKFDKK